jgi:multidrug efflux pump subunit AcrA (membrane-fusion protein)
MSLTAMIPTGTQAELLTVSKDAILRNPAGEYVYYNNNGAAALAPITRLFSVGSRVVIRSPMIRPGVQIVVDGNERMYPTQPMTIIQIDGEPHTTLQAPQSGSDH